MTVASQPARYNLRIPHMHGRWSGGLRIGWLAAFFLVATLVPSLLAASLLGDAARQLAHKISSVTGPGAIALEITNRSSLDEKAVREVRSALEAELRTGGVRTAAADESMGSVQVTLSESIREYVWSAEVVIGSDERGVVLVSAPRSSDPITTSADHTYSR